MMEQAAGVWAAVARLRGLASHPGALFLVPRWSVPCDPFPDYTGTRAFTPSAALGWCVDRAAPPSSKEHADFCVLGSGHI